MKTRGFILWLTGLPGAGKSTLGRGVALWLRGRGYKTELLDGDEVRTLLCKDLGYTKADRDTNIRRIGYVANLLARNDVIAIVAAISPYREVRDEIRKQSKRFVEVFVECPIEILEKRDPKGHYTQARQGLIPHFTGISDPYEPPLHPEVNVRTDLETIRQSTQKILSALRKMKFVVARTRRHSNKSRA